MKANAREFTRKSYFVVVCCVPLRPGTIAATLKAARRKHFGFCETVRNAFGTSFMRNACVWDGTRPNNKRPNAKLKLKPKMRVQSYIVVPRASRF